MNHSYHDLYITTSFFDRTSIFNLPYSIRVTCTRTGGWEVWELWGGMERQLGGEWAGPDKWLVLDVAGHVILDSRKEEDGLSQD